MKINQLMWAPTCGGQRLVEPLTVRELEILDLICDGYTNREVARRKGITSSTVKFHISQIFGKLGVGRRTQAVAVAVHLELVRPDWLPGTPQP